MGSEEHKHSNYISIDEEVVKVAIEGLDEAIFQLGDRINDQHPAQVLTIARMKEVIASFESAKKELEGAL